MMYIKFLYKDIFKNKLLWILTAMMMTMLCLVLSFGLHSIKDIFEQGEFQRLRISRQNLDFKKDDWDKLVQVLNNKKYFSLYFEEIQGCKVIILGEEFFSNDSLQVEKHLYTNRRINAMSYYNLDGCIIEKGDINKIDSINRVVFESVLTNITSNDVELVKELSNITFKTVAIRFENISNESYQINATIIGSMLVCIIIFQIMMYYTMYQYQVFKQRIEYMIHQFYGSNYIHIFVRTGLYFLTIFIPAYLVIKTVRIPLSLTILITGILLLWLFFIVEIMKVNRKGVKKMIQLKEVSKTYYDKNQKYVALDKINLEIKQGEVVIIVGESGAGKSTLLNVVGLTLSNYEGEYLLNNIDVNHFSNIEKASFRNAYFGYIFQNYLLVENDSVYDNVEIPLLYSKKFNPNEKKKRIKEIVEKVGLTNHLYKKVSKLSGGEKQRVAIARSLVNMPEVILMDEPTSALNEEMSKTIMDLIYNYVRENNKTLIIVTHDLNRVVNGEYRKIFLKNGKMISDEYLVEKV